jgi:hypothetical protein
LHFEYQYKHVTTQKKTLITFLVKLQPDLLKIDYKVQSQLLRKKLVESLMWRRIGDQPKKKKKEKEKKDCH